MSTKFHVMRVSALALLALGAGAVHAATFYVDASVAVSGNGLTAGTAKKTITEGITLAGTGGDRVEVASGTYDELVTLNKNNVTLIGTGATKPIIAPALGKPRTSVVALNGTNMTIENFEIRVRQPAATGRSGSIAFNFTIANTSGQSVGIYGDDARSAVGTDLFSGVVIRNNKIVLTPSGTGDNTFAFAGIALVNNTGATGAESATITGNEIIETAYTGAISLGGPFSFNQALFGRAMYVVGLNSTITGNTLRGWFSDMQTQQDIVSTFSGNTLRGGGIEYSNPLAGNINVTGNTFTPNFVFTNVTGTPIGVPNQALYILGNNPAVCPINISGNTFAVQVRALFNAASDNTNIFDNTFTVSTAPAGLLYTVKYLEFERYFIGANMSALAAWGGLDVNVTGNDFGPGPAGTIGINIANELTLNSPAALGIPAGPTVLPLANREPNPTYSNFTVCSNNFDASLIAVRNAVNAPASQTFSVSGNYFGNPGGPGVGATVASVAPASLTTAGFLSANSDTNTDADVDGIVDATEACVYGFDPTKKDTNGDGIEDGVEARMRTNPVVALTVGQLADSDGDGLPNSVDPGTGADFDGDKYRDAYEFLVGTNPNSAASKPNLGNVDNADAGVAFSDGVKMMRVFVGLDSLGSLNNPTAFDVNRDGLNDNLDAVITINFALNNIPTLPFPQ